MSLWSLFFFETNPGPLGLEALNSSSLSIWIRAGMGRNGLRGWATRHAPCYGYITAQQITPPSNHHRRNKPLIVLLQLTKVRNRPKFEVLRDLYSSNPRVKLMKAKTGTQHFHFSDLNMNSPSWPGLTISVIRSMFHFVPYHYYYLLIIMTRGQPM